ncbi:hypothetical protein AC625_06605 [Peribacillus loiseleuriae]|uniref:Uncharacterized protein n=1 Tax=Peribacillus loiseleuriae TaxID=1679170 RepID=A0A0K9H135_9BACI|nr:hypothetical protein AC625_06605 [Peribacillus loiseleuriae]
MPSSYIHFVSAARASSYPIFTKEQIRSSEQYRGQRDLVEALLKDNQTYTLKQVETTINGFLKGVVK